MADLADTMWLADRHVGSNPTPSANAKAPIGCLFALAGNLCEKPFCIAKVGSHLSLKPMGACSQEARRKIFAEGEYPTPSAILALKFCRISRLFSLIVKVCFYRKKIIKHLGCFNLAYVIYVLINVSCNKYT